MSVFRSQKHDESAKTMRMVPPPTMTMSMDSEYTLPNKPATMNGFWSNLKTSGPFVTGGSFGAAKNIGHPMAGEFNIANGYS